MPYTRVLWYLLCVLNSCSGRCGAGLDTSFSCQCNSYCSNFNDCCQDYSTLCTAGGNTGCGSFADLTQKLWDNDVDRLPIADVTVNPQSLVTNADFRDKSGQKLFSNVDESKLSSAVYRTYLALLDNYDPDKFDAELVSAQEQAEEDTFLDALMATSTIQALYDYLHCQGKVQSTSDLRAQLKRLWFDLYARSPSSPALDTSGFEHVMVGEYKSSSQVNGLHYWLAFYLEERSGEIEYYGHSCTTRANTICAAYQWNGRTKTGSSFFLRTSPAFDIAVYTACFMLYPGQVCPAVIDGKATDIKTYSAQGHVATAFVVHH